MVGWEWPHGSRFVESEHIYPDYNHGGSLPTGSAHGVGPDVEMVPALYDAHGKVTLWRYMRNPVGYAGWEETEDGDERDDQAQGEAA